VAPAKERYILEPRISCVYCGRVVLGTCPWRLVDPAAKSQSQARDVKLHYKLVRSKTRATTRSNFLRHGTKAVVVVVGLDQGYTGNVMWWCENSDRGSGSRETELYQAPPFCSGDTAGVQFERSAAATRVMTHKNKIPRYAFFYVQRNAGLGDDVFRYVMCGFGFTSSICSNRQSEEPPISSPDDHTHIPDW